MAFDSLPLPLEKWQQIASALKLSPRQQRIVELILANFCDKQILAKLGGRQPTLRTQLKRVFARAGVEDRQGLVILILRMSHEPRHP